MKDNISFQTDEPSLNSFSSKYETSTSKPSRRRAKSFFEYPNLSSEGTDSYFSRSMSCSDLSASCASLHDTEAEFFKVPSVPTPQQHLNKERKFSADSPFVELDTAKEVCNIDLQHDAIVAVLLHYISTHHTHRPSGMLSKLYKAVQNMGLFSNLNLYKSVVDIYGLKSLVKDFSDLMNKWLSKEGSSLLTPGLRKSESESSLFESFSHHQSTRKKQVCFGSRQLVPAPTAPTGPTFLDMLCYNDVSRFHVDFKLLRKLGQGGFGSVYHVAHRIDGREYAVKTVKFSFKDTFQLRRAYTKVVREVKSLANLDHSNVVRYHQAWFEPSNQLYEQLEGLKGFASNNVSEDEESTDESETLTKPFDGPSEISIGDLDIGNPFQFEFDESLEANNLFHFETFSEVDDSKQMADSGCCHLEECIANPDNVEFPESPPKCDEDLPNPTVAPKSDRSVKDSEAQQIPGPTFSLVEQLYNSKKNRFEAVMYIQMQLCSTKTLEQWLQSPPRQTGQVNDAETANILRQIVSGLAHIHKMGVIHRDLKPANIFFSEGQVKIGDFGLAKPFGQQNNQQDVDIPTTKAVSAQVVHTSGVGTVTYASPEQMTQQFYNEKSDIYSLGIIIFELYHPYFSTKSERARVFQQLRKGNIPQHMKQRFPTQMELVSKCLSIDPTERPSAEAILQMDWLNLEHYQASFESLLQEKEKALEEQQKLIEQLQAKLKAIEGQHTQDTLGCIAT